MTFAKPNLDLHFARESAPPPPPELGPDGYTRLIAAAWQFRTEDQRQRYLNDERNRPVPAWFQLDGQSKGKR
ncbi:MAG: hypothetical protein AB7V14_01730 [Kiritimatiellia bacterium]